MLPVPACIECAYLAGSERTPQWLFASGRGYCDHEERKGGRWNIVQPIEGDKGMTCANFARADDEKIALRRKGLTILRQRFGEQCATGTRLPSNRKGEVEEV